MIFFVSNVFLSNDLITEQESNVIFYFLNSERSPYLIFIELTKLFVDVAIIFVWLVFIGSNLSSMTRSANA